jgi:hypothetical protein
MVKTQSKRLLVLAICVSMVGITQAGCVVRTGFTATTGPAPDLVMIDGGVYVVENYDRPVFYDAGFYWWYNGGRWYRSTYYDGGWVAVGVGVVPYRVRRIDRRRYVRYRARNNARRRRINRRHRRAARRNNRRMRRDNRRNNRRMRRDNRRTRRDNRRNNRQMRRDNRRDRRTNRREKRGKRRDDRRDRRRDRRDYRR